MNRILVWALLGLCIALGGCRTTIPMPDYGQQTIANYGQSQPDIKQVEQSIIKAAVSLGWQAHVVETGKVEATLNIRTHQLVVMIQYDETSYDIDYVDSTNLKYDGKSIHRQYANWVRNLMNRINANNVRN